MADDDSAGEGLPRGGHAGERARLGVGGLVLLLVSPVAVLVAAVTLRVVMGQVHRGWRDITVAAATVSAAILVLLVLWVSLTGVTLTGWVAGTAVLGVPLGAAAGAGAVGLLERWAAGAEWHPAERRRQAVEDKREARRATEVADPDLVALSPVPVLAVFRGGDLAPWVRGDYVVPPSVKVPAMGAIGESGSGKTETVKRLNWLWAHQKTRVIFADFKGSDPKLPEQVIAAYLDARPDADCRLWPAQPLDIWQGDSDEIAGRLMKVQDYSRTVLQGGRADSGPPRGGSTRGWATAGLRGFPSPPRPRLPGTRLQEHPAGRGCGRPENAADHGRCPDAVRGFLRRPVIQVRPRVLLGRR